ncbi:hypothetical protein Pfo_015359 [Paulownia fortunei]|nr:hypothetical protein Pfo_015359 [Paulownia fortunei]
MIIDTTEIQVINSFSRLESLKEVYRIIWILVPILTLILGITLALADGTKLLFKEKLLPSREDTCLFSIGSSIAVISILLSYSVIPFSYCFILVNLSISFFYGSPFQLLLPLEFLGRLRDAAQSISYEIPLTLCILSVSLHAIR